MKHMKILIIVFAFLLLLNVSCGKKSIDEKDILAQVGSESLTIQDIETQFPDAMQGRLTVDQIKGKIELWINTQLVYQQAQRLGLHNTLRDELEREIKQLEVFYLANKVVEREITRKIQVTDQEINDYYEKNKEQFTRSVTEIKAYHLLVKSKENATEVMSLLKSKEPLQEISKKYNEPSPIWPNGDLGYFPLEVLPDMIKKPLSRLKVGEITSRGIESDFGTHFFEIIDKQPPGSIKSLQEVKEQIIETLKVEKRNEAYQAYLAKLRARANEQNLLKVNYEILKNFQSDSTNMLVK